MRADIEPDREEPDQPGKAEHQDEFLVGGRLVVLDLRGEITTFGDDTIRTAYREATGLNAMHVLLNFAGVDYINSAGISIIIGVMGEARNAGQQVLVTGLTSHYQKVFRMMGLTQFAPIFETEEAARSAVADQESE